MHLCSVRVYYQDTDAGGIVYHSKYLDFAERARSEYLRDLGYPVLDLLQNNVAFIIRRATLDYKASAKLDDLLTIETTVKEIKSASLMMQQRFLREGQELVVLTLEVVFIHPQTMRPIRIPADLKAVFEQQAN